MMVAGLMVFMQAEANEREPGPGGFGLWNWDASLEPTPSFSTQIESASRNPRGSIGQHLIQRIQVTSSLSALRTRCCLF